MTNIFVDNSDSNLNRKIKQAQYDPEPTVAQYLNPIKPNLRRNPVIQAQQVPTSQILDEHTTEAKVQKALEDIMTKGEKKEKAAKDKAEAFQNSWLGVFSNAVSQLAPTAATLRLGRALQSGDYNKIGIELAHVAQESIRKNRRAETSKAAQKRRKKATDVAELKELIEKMKKKMPKKQLTTHKGQKVDVPSN